MFLNAAGKSMSRSYDAAAAALALNIPFKWVDNLLSRHRIPGVEQSAQGSTRRLSPAAILRLEVIRLLNEDLGLPVTRAVSFAERLCSAPGGSVAIGHGAGQLMVDLPGIDRRLAARLADAVESAPRRTRGRPPRRPPARD